MANQTSLDHLFLDISDRVSEESASRRAKVGAVIARDGNILSMGWNGTPSGMDNNCEIENDDGTLTTKPEVLHAESNAILKIAARGGLGAVGATLYTTFSPCPECAKLTVQAGIKRVVFRHQYRITDGLEMLKNLGIDVQQLPPRTPCRTSPKTTTS